MDEEEFKSLLREDGFTAHWVDKIWSIATEDLKKWIKEHTKAQALADPVFIARLEDWHWYEDFAL